MEEQCHVVIASLQEELEMGEHHVKSEMSSDLDGEVGSKSEVGVLGLSSSSGATYSEPTRESFASSSRSHLRSYFVGMGFPPTLVDKVLEENGEDNADSLLETLFAHTAIKKSSPESSDLLDDCKDESSSSDFALDDEEVEETATASEFNADKRSSLLKMNFSVGEVDFAISKLGCEAPVHELVEFIVAAQIAQNSGKDGTDPAQWIADNLMPLTAGEEHKGKCSLHHLEIVTDSLFKTMDKTLRLLEMGFTGDEISFAIDKCGAEAPVEELADLIFLNRNAGTCVKDEKGQSSNNSMHHSHGENDSNLWSPREETGVKRPYFDTPVVKTEASSSNATGYAEYMDSKELLKGKKPKLEYDDYISAYFSPSVPEPRPSKPQPRSYTSSPHKLSDYMLDETKMPKQLKSIPCKSIHQMVGKPPYFFYGNVMDVAHDTWARISQFLYSITPEFVNSQFFSALSRKEGYIHNLPTENRTYIFPKSPMTIEDVIPQAKRWWPSWDTRKQLCCISSETHGTTQLCERLEEILIDSQGMLSKEQQTDILYHCKTMNLMWVGPNNLSAIEPEQLEIILGYPPQHTKVLNFDISERLRSLKYCFQTDTLGYHISALKQLFPWGLTVLSLYSGVGGVEVALHRLGLQLKTVISVETSEMSRRILRRWWQNTEQRGQLVQIDDTKRVTSTKLKKLMDEFGGFDFVICQNPCTYVSSSSKLGFDDENPAGLDFSKFFEFVRILQCVRSSMERR